MSSVQTFRQTFRRRSNSPARAISCCPLIFPTSWTSGPRTRSVAAAREEAQATAADYETAKLSSRRTRPGLFRTAQRDAQKQLLDDTVKAYTDNLQLTLNRFKGGVAPKSDVAQAQTQLDTTRVQDTDVAVQRAQFEHAIAILIGKPPAEFSLAAAPFNYQPPSTPIGLPSELLQRRPDIAAAERRVAEANQQIASLARRYFPTVILAGTAGFSGSQGSNWFAGRVASGPSVLPSRRPSSMPGAVAPLPNRRARTMTRSLPIVQTH